MKSKLQKIIAIVGPTASGKSELAVKIARRFNGEIISADSRQVYQGLNIGTGKVPNDCSNPSRIKSNIYRIKRRKRIRNKFDIICGKFEKYVYKDIPHHCIDFVSPKKVFTVADFKKCAESAIKNITAKGKIPIICGGSGFYIDSVLYNLPIPNVPPNKKLRAKLSKKSAEELYKMLKKLDPWRAKSIDRHNPRRLIRAIEIVKTTQKPIPPLTRLGLVSNKTESCYIGIKITMEKLYKRIDQRLRQRLKQGMIQEVKNLLKNGVSHKRLQSLGLEYRFISLYLQNKLTHKEMAKKLKTAIHQYAKRQMTWFRRNKDIKWITSKKMALSLIKKFIAKK